MIPMEAVAAIVAPITKSRRLRAGMIGAGDCALSSWPGGKCALRAHPTGGGSGFTLDSGSPSTFPVCHRDLADCIEGLLEETEHRRRCPQPPDPWETLTTLTGTAGSTL
jgi:hypothetical protein